MNCSPTPDPQQPFTSQDRRPNHWMFCKMLRQVREKRSFTLEEAARCLPGVSTERLQEWELGSRAPVAFVETLVIWRLNTAPRPRPQPRRAPISHGPSVGDGATTKRILFPSLVAVGLTLGALSVKPEWAERTGILALAVLVAESATEAVGHPVTAEQCAEYARSLGFTLQRFSHEELHSVFGELTDLAESILD